MGWLVGYVIASMVGAFVAVRIFDHIFSGVTGSIAGVARASLFVGVWTAITAGSGMRAFTRRMRQLRQKFRGADPKE